MCCDIIFLLSNHIGTTMEKESGKQIVSLSDDSTLRSKLTDYLKELFGLEISEPSLLLIFKDCDINMTSLLVWPESEAAISLEMQIEQWFFMRFVGRAPKIDRDKLSIRADEASVLAVAVRDPHWKDNLHSPHALGFKATVDASDELTDLAEKLSE